jgi:hypothetical protein
MSNQIKDLAKILKEVGIPKETPVNFIKGKRKEILEYAPFSTYNNNSQGEDSHHKERARILDKNGKTLFEVVEGYTATYSDGSTGGRSGESVGTALKKLEKKSQFAKYVLVEGRDEKTDNTIVTSKSEYHECRGLKTKDETKVSLYELN